MAIVFDYDRNFVIEPGARERIAERLKDIPEINKERPCWKCAFFNRNCIISCRSTNCNFNHDSFVERTGKEFEFEME